MKSVLKLTRQYQGVPKYWIEFLWNKFNRIEGTPYQRERALEKFLDAVAEMAKDPYDVKVGDCTFSKIACVEQVRLPIGHRMSEPSATLYKDFRFGITTDGTIIGCHSDEGTNLNWSYIDTQFYYTKNKEDRDVFWHMAFMDKVIKLYGEAKTQGVEILTIQNRFANDDPELIINEAWLEGIKVNISYYCKIQLVQAKHTPMDVYGNIKEIGLEPLKHVLMRADKTIDEMCGVNIVRTSGRRNIYNEMQAINVLVDRYVDWALLKGIPLRSILDYKLSDLFKEFWVGVEEKANALRDEFLERYGFERINKPWEHTSLHERNWATNNDNKFGWKKSNNGNTVFIDDSGTVYINEHRICIIGMKNDNFLPVGDKIVQRVVAVGTNLRNDIYTLTEYRPMLEEMFGGETYLDSLCNE